MSVENKAHRAQASVFSLFWCLTHLGLSSAVYETTSFRYKMHEGSSPACSLLFTALTVSKADFQGEALISDLCTGLLVVHLQCALLSRLTKVQGVVLPGTCCVYIWLTNSLCCCTPARLLGRQPWWCQWCMSPSCPGQAGSGDWGGTAFLRCLVCQQVKRVTPAWAALAGCLYHANVIVCRMHKHMQMTTACCSWRRRQRQR